MNRILKTLIFPALAALSLAACNDIDESERFIEVDPVKPARMVLIEDFTGQNCVNCPDAHKVIEQLREQYPDGVVAVSIHAGDFAIDKSLTDFSRNYIGLMTEEGSKYNDSYGIDSWPAGVVNRRGGATKHDNWAAAVRKELETEADCAIKLEAAVADGKLSATLKLEPKADIDGSLCLWVVESGIVARQRSTSGFIRDYVHDNVFRAAINGVDGESVNLRAGIHREAAYSIELRDNDCERWVPENLAVVAFVCDAAGVHQVAYCPASVQDTNE